MPDVSLLLPHSQPQQNRKMKAHSETATPCSSPPAQPSTACLGHAVRLQPHLSHSLFTSSASSSATPCQPASLYLIVVDYGAQKTHRKHMRQAAAAVARVNAAVCALGSMPKTACFLPCFLLSCACICIVELRLTACRAHVQLLETCWHHMQQAASRLSTWKQSPTLTGCTYFVRCRPYPPHCSSAPCPSRTTRAADVYKQGCCCCCCKAVSWCCC